VAVAELVASLVGPDAPLSVRAYDGSRAGADDARATLVIRSAKALRRFVTAPNELGLARAYVAGDLDIEGDVFALLELRQRFETLRVRPDQLLQALRLVGVSGLRPLPPPPEEARLHGRRHSKARDAAAISYHYDVSNEFYRLVLGPSMTYSCAVWDDTTTTLEDAQAKKHELVCRKLALRPGMRLLDVGCGWGGLLVHAAREHGVRAVGVTLSRRQAELASKRVADAGLGDAVEIRYQDYRDVADGPFDAISSIGMFEHVGWSQLAVYFARCYDLLAPGARMLNHGIGKPAEPSSSRGAQVLDAVRSWRGGRLASEFIDRYVFPDGELHDVGTVVTLMQQTGFEVRHIESLREHYPLTLRRWLANLEANWDAAVREAGEARARVWRLYMAASATTFEDNTNQVHHVLAVKPVDGRSGFPLRPDFV
jgi:cyclopropane-fatty-acyl-phospholipid synthase